MTAINEDVCDEQKSLLLSNILDRLFVGTEHGVNIMRLKRDIQFYLAQDDDDTVLFQTGSSAEGFLHDMWSDMDFMDIYRNVVVTYPKMFHKVYSSSKSDKETVLFMKEDNCRPGFVLLYLGHYGQQALEILLRSIVLIEKTQFVSSDKFRENMVIVSRCFYPHGGSSHGPCFQLGETPHREKPLEKTIAFPCVGWPEAAEEWITRTRLYGWPSEDVIRRIIKDGCHVVPIGDKCSRNMHMEWRISFATAERRLIYSLTHIQFKVYGLLKYILRQLKDRMREDIGDEDILCSYFLKTVLFYAVENSPKSLWQEKNLFVCFWRCFTMLIDWVRAAYCPHYFISEYNLFQRKIHGENQTRLFSILGDLYQMGWKCLSLGPVYQPSIWELLQEQVCHPTSTPSSLLEVLRVADFIRGMTGSPVFYTTTSVRKSLIMLAKSKADTDEIFSYYAFASLLVESAMTIFMEHTSRGKNKDQYKFLKRCKHRLIPHAVFGTNILYLASFHFRTGNYTKVAQMCKKVASSAKLLNPDEEETKRWMHEYCGRGYTTLYKLQQGYGDYMMFGFPSQQKFCLPELYTEIINQEPYPLHIHPDQYAAFLLFLCCHEKGDITERDKALHRLEGLKYIEPRIWVVHTLLGICYERKRDKHRAVRAYEDSLNALRQGNPAQERINAIKKGRDDSL